MKWYESLVVALRALTKNKLRSLLTILGVVIGVASLIAMVALGEGAKATVEASFARMGSNLLIIMPGAGLRMGARSAAGDEPTLTWDDLKAIKEISEVRGVAPNLRKSTQVVSSNANWSTTVTGTSPDYFVIRNWTSRVGRFFDEADVLRGRRGAVLGNTVANELFGEGIDPSGQFIRIGQVPFEVMSVADAKGSSPMGSDYDDVVFVPATTFQQKIQGTPSNFINGTIFVGGTSEEALGKIERDVRSLLRERHRIAPGDADDFTIRNLTEMASAREQSTKAVTLLLACVAFVSLVVGGIGIMNIMLVSVRERTKEIGIRLAVGATPADILWQFLAEAVALSAIGGLLGIALGIGVAKTLATKLMWPILFRHEITLIAVGCSAIVGVFFGLLPAYQASRMSPIAALKVE